MLSSGTYNPLWRGDLSPFGCEAVVNPVHADIQLNRSDGFGAAAQPNGDKAPRHRKLLSI
nr:hypothetical protein FEE99_01395 [Pseudomonas sp. ef1]